MDHGEEKLNIGYVGWVCVIWINAHAIVTTTNAAIILIANVTKNIISFFFS